MLRCVAPPRRSAPNCAPKTAPSGDGRAGVGGKFEHASAVSDMTTGQSPGLQTRLEPRVGLNAPSVFANGFLNGQTTLPLAVNVSLGGTDFPTVLNVPLDGILVPAAPYTAVVDGSALGIPGLTFNPTGTGTPISGLLPGLLNF